METIARTFIIPSAQNQFIQEKVFNNAPIPIFQENPFHYRKFGLRELRIVRGGRGVVSIDTTNNSRACVTTMKAMNFNEEIPALPNDFFTDWYVLVFDLNSIQKAGENDHYPELSGETLRSEMFFERPLTNVTKPIVLRERMSIVKIDQFGTVAKNVWRSLHFSRFFNFLFNFLWFLYYCLLRWSICWTCTFITQLQPFSYYTIKIGKGWKLG